MGLSYEDLGGMTVKSKSKAAAEEVTDLLLYQKMDQKKVYKNSLMNNLTAKFKYQHPNKKVYA